eukprot:2791988-Amphidinium_carterae.1
MYIGNEITAMKTLVKDLENCKTLSELGEHSPTVAIVIHHVVRPWAFHHINACPAAVSIQDDIDLALQIVENVLPNTQLPLATRCSVHLRGKEDVWNNDTHYPELVTVLHSWASTSPLMTYSNIQLNTLQTIPMYEDGAGQKRCMRMMPMGKCKSCQATKGGYELHHLCLVQRASIAILKQHGLIPSEQHHRCCSTSHFGINLIWGEEHYGAIALGLDRTEDQIISGACRCTTTIAVAHSHTILVVMRTA